MISIIVAVGENLEIGYENKMPWHLPADLAYFKKVTTGHPIVMGRKTFESIGRALPNRTNIVLTRDKDFTAEGCLVVNTIGEVLKFSNKEEIFVIGGANIYKQILPYASKLYLTKIKQSFEADTFFPKISKEWKLVSNEKHDRDEKNKYEYEFQVYDFVG